MPMCVRSLIAAGLTLLGAQSALADCANGTGACEIANGTYFAERPETGDTPVGALIFIHGYNSSGQGMMKARGMVDAALRRGYLVVAPSGSERPGRPGRSWAFHPDRPGPRDEIAFLRDVRDDVTDRFGVDPQSVLLAGFSVGGSLAAYTACTDPDAFAAYAPVGGNFWRPVPDACAGPAPMLHTHGWRDGTVPLEGRVLGGRSLDDPDAFAQGNLFDALQVWTETNACPTLQPRAFPQAEGFMRRAWTGCAAPLEFALFDGGHGIPPGWTDMALDWFESLGS